MMHRLVFLIQPRFCWPASRLPTKATVRRPVKPRQAADGHPDLSGIWAYAIDLPPVTLKKEINGKVSVTEIDQSAAKPAKNAVPGALPSTSAPSYKPEFRQKVKDLFDNESKTDEVFYCGKPGVPRIGPPRQNYSTPRRDGFPLRRHFGRPLPHHPHRWPRRTARTRIRPTTEIP